jgi:hypothetical protein
MSNLKDTRRRRTKKDTINLKEEIMEDMAWIDCFGNIVDGFGGALLSVVGPITLNSKLNTPKIL